MLFGGGLLLEAVHLAILACMKSAWASGAVTWTCAGREVDPRDGADRRRVNHSLLGRGFVLLAMLLFAVDFLVRGRFARAAC